MTTTLNVGGSEFDAIDFFYESTPGADFTNYRLNFETTNGSMIYDPLPGQWQDAGSDAIDTFMNTVGSFLGIGDASQIYNTYRPTGLSLDPSPIARLDWSVFDTLSGDTNTMAGHNPAPYHMGRVLVKRDALWHATFTAFDTASPGVPSAFNFTNDPSWTFPEPVLPPPPITPVLPDPPNPPPVVPGPITPPPNPHPQPPPLSPPPTFDPPSPPIVTAATTINIGGSGLNAIDFYYASSPGADFTNYRLNFATTNGSLIHDPLPGVRQDVGSDAIDTFMNTVGSSLGLSDASQIHNTYHPGGANSDPASVSHIDWSVFDTLAGDTNSIAGVGDAPYHMARVLVSPDALWDAKFTAFDTANPGIANIFDFSNSPQPPAPDPVLPPTDDPTQSPTVLPPVIEEPLDPPPSIPDTPPADPELGPDDGEAVQIFPLPNVGDGDVLHVFPYPGDLGEIIYLTPGWWIDRDADWDLTEAVPYPIPVVTTFDASDDYGIVYISDTPTDAELQAFALPVALANLGRLSQSQMFGSHATTLLSLHGQGAQSHDSRSGVPEPSSALLAALGLMALPAFARRCPNRRVSSV
jgi:hypothetical protein